MKPLLSVIIPSYNPDEKILTRVISALLGQTLDCNTWELIIINNDSSKWPADSFFSQFKLPNLKIIDEQKPGATYARKCGLENARSGIAILVDDDNILDSNYLKCAVDLLEKHPRVGAIGGRMRLEFAEEPPDWLDEFHGILGAWDHGDKPLISNGIRPPGFRQNQYPYFAPLTAGLVLKRAAWEAWLSHLQSRPIMKDRCRDELSSGGDNDAILAIMSAGWEVAYFPQLSFINHIPPFRLSPDYLAKLNYECKQGLIRALRRHSACPWPLIPKWTLPLRIAKSWVLNRAWSDPKNKIRWSGHVGLYNGLVK